MFLVKERERGSVCLVKTGAVRERESARQRESERETERKRERKREREKERERVRRVC